MSMADKFINLCKLFLFIQKSNLKTAFLNKSDAVVNVLMMTINNLSFVFMWWVIFQNKGSVNGWHFGDMALLFAVMNNAFATFALFARGIQTLPEYIDNGNLDNYLISPRSSLFLISTSESTFANWGDYVTGFLVYFMSGYVSLKSFGIMLLCSFLAFLLIYGFRLLVSCLAFFVSDSQRLGDNITMSLLTFASQPASIFTGWYKLVFLTIIPAGLISLYPVELIRNFNFIDLGILCCGVFAFLGLGIWAYRQDLKHYGSGNRFGVR